METAPPLVITAGLLVLCLVCIRRLCNRLPLRWNGTAIRHVHTSFFGVTAVVAKGSGARQRGPAAAKHVSVDATRMAWTAPSGVSNAES